MLVVDPLSSDGNHMNLFYALWGSHWDTCFVRHKGVTQFCQGQETKEV